MQKQGFCFRWTDNSAIEALDAVPINSR
jgi:hypothetical protein